MKRYPELKPNKWDLVPALLITALAVFCAVTVWSRGNDTDSLTAVISVDGEMTETVALEQLTAPTERTLTAGEYTLHLVLTAQGVRVEYSDCPTQDCVNTGTISRNGQSIVCLPGRVIVELKGGDAASDSPDVVIG